MTAMRAALLSSVATLLALPALARADAADLGKAPEELWRTFSAEPWFSIPATVALGLHARGLVRMKQRGRLTPRVARRSTAWVLSSVVVAVALCTPLDALSSALFSAHMLQHLLLVSIAAPLAALSRPGPAMAWGLSSRARRRVAHALRVARPLRPLVHALVHPAGAFALHLGAVTLWHLPALYEAALYDDRVHALEHASFFFTAWLFWRAIVVAGRPGQMGHGVAVLYAFGGALAGSALGAVLTGATAPWYRAHAGGPEGFGLTLLEDQQIAGLAMWVPGGLVYLLAAVLSFGAWLRASEAASRSTDRALRAALKEVV